MRSNPYEQEEDAHYRISVVSNLTGLPANTIRTWERRYGVVEPRRSEGGTRLYSEEDIARLQLIRALCQCDENIGAIASLNTDQLRQRLAVHTGDHEAHRVARAASGGLRAVILDHALLEQLRANPRDWGAVELLVSASSREELERQFVPGTEVDVLLINLAELGREPLEAFGELRDLIAPRLTLVLYEFAKRETLAALVESGARLKRAPVRLAALRQVLEDHMSFVRLVDRSQGAEAAPSQSEEEPIPTRRFDDVQLARLHELRSGIECECPNHISGLVSALVAFEAYSVRCESRGEDDARLHAMIYKGTAQARALMEELLERVCRHEGIDV